LIGRTRPVRLFVAALPDKSTVDRLRGACGGWPRPTVAGLRWTGPDQWHVTLRFLGSVDPGEAAAALDGLGWAAARPGWVQWPRYSGGGSSWCRWAAWTAWPVRWRPRQ